MGSIDADAHVIESPLTWEHVPEEDADRRPLILDKSWGPERRSLPGRVVTQYWLIDNRIRQRNSQQHRSKTDVVTGGDLPDAAEQEQPLH